MHARVRACALIISVPNHRPIVSLSHHTQSPGLRFGTMLDEKSKVWLASDTRAAGGLLLGPSASSGGVCGSSQDYCICGMDVSGRPTILVMERNSGAATRRSRTGCL